ncbi:HNH endonuclease [Paraburkholderia sp. C35]|uniref:HNH endonuclease n=1 Tax=Paraburkholderia sp. C35 TaxID=2126993 RepID=UPI000D69A5B7|nr:HNH endonuclease [Paraburkholderia sp. C35]
MPSVFARPTQRRVPVYDEFDLEEQDDAQVEQPEPVEVEPVPSLREAFLAAVNARLAVVPRVPQKRWVRARVKSNTAGTCMYCARPVSEGDVELGRAFIDFLIPESAGGTRIVENMVVACTTCYAEKGNRDWLSFGRAVQPAALTKNRREALRYADNHVLPLTVKGTRAAERVFARRWESPRFVTFAGVFRTGGVFAWDTRTVSPGRSGEVTLSLRMGFGGKVSNDGEHLLVVEVPRDAFHAAAWMLIEENVLLRRVDLTGPAAVAYRPFSPTLDAEHQERWWVTLPGRRWEQEARRVAQWSKDALPLQRDMERDELVRAALAPVRQGFVQASASIAAIFREVV